MDSTMFYVGTWRLLLTCFLIRCTEAEAYVSRLTLTVQDVQSCLILFQLLIAWNIWRSCALAIHPSFLLISSTIGRIFSLNSGSTLSAIQRYLLSAILSTFLVYQIVICRGSLFGCCHGGPIMRGIAFWLNLRL